MEIELTEIEARILGCLIEKELTTPEYYPLSLNALTNACNQKSNRDPVMELDETVVVRALDSLRFKQLALQSAEGGRVPKYRHCLMERFRLDPAELAIMCELLVRGPQTTGELRTRGERMHHFPDLENVEGVLEELMNRTAPLVTRLERQPGRKECRYAHLFSGEPKQATQENTPSPESARLKVAAVDERIAKLEEEVDLLRQQVADLQQQMQDFKAQFE